MSASLMSMASKFFTGSYPLVLLLTHAAVAPIGFGLRRTVGRLFILIKGARIKVCVHCGLKRKSLMEEGLRIYSTLVLVVEYSLAVFMGVDAMM